MNIGEGTSRSIVTSAISTHLQVTKLRKVLPTVVEFTRKRFDLLVHDAMSSNVSSLCESFPTSIASVRSFSGVSSLMGLMVT